MADDDGTDYARLLGPDRMEICHPRSGTETHSRRDRIFRCLDAEVSCLHVLVARQLAAAALYGDLATLEHVCALHEGQGARHVLLNQQDRGTHRMNLLDLLKRRVGDHWSKPKRRLIKHQ